MPAEFEPFLSPPVFWLLVFISIWELVWKSLALWRAARKGHKGWFVVLMLFNTAGILPIIYIHGHPTAEKPAA
jgi:hypothetical protein